MADKPDYCGACDGTGQVRDLQNADATLEGDPAEYRDTTPFIDCGECKGTGIKTAVAK